MAAMELTPKHSTSWWSLFDCCHTPSASSLPNDEDHDGHCNERNNSFRFPFAPSINVVTKRGKIVAGEEGAAFPETPSTACTGSSAGASFEPLDDDFIGEITILSTDSKTNALTFEDEDDFTDEDAVIIQFSDHQKRSVTFEDVDDDDMSDPDNYWYADLSFSSLIMCYEQNLDENRSSANSLHIEDDADDVPEIDTNTPTLTVSSLTQDNAEVKFFQFVFVVMLRHLFESWLPRQLFQGGNILTSGSLSNIQNKEYRAMKTRKLQVADNQFEVIPQLNGTRGLN